jgi:hypothetical protein
MALLRGILGGRPLGAMTRAWVPPGPGSSTGPSTQTFGRAGARASAFGTRATSAAVAAVSATAASVLSSKGGASGVTARVGVLSGAAVARVSLSTSHAALAPRGAVSAGGRFSAGRSDARMGGQAGAIGEKRIAGSAAGQFGLRGSVSGRTTADESLVPSGNAWRTGARVARLLSDSRAARFRR